MERYRIGNGYDVHALREGLPMWLCGVRIESEAGFVAHSDGDVAFTHCAMPFSERRPWATSDFTSRTAMTDGKALTASCF